MRQFNGLNQSVQDLVTHIGQGQKALAQIMARQELAIYNHIDKRLESHEQRTKTLQLQAQLKNSLFFPEIFSRRDNISDAFGGTCRWIFDSDSLEDRRIQKRWPNFVYWLKNSTSILNQASRSAFIVQ